KDVFRLFRREKLISARLAAQIELRMSTKYQIFKTIRPKTPDYCRTRQPAMTRHIDAAACVHDVGAKTRRRHGQVRNAQLLAESTLGGRVRYQRPPSFGPVHQILRADAIPVSGWPSRHRPTGSLLP